MKTLILFAFSFLGFAALSQEDTTFVVSDSSLVNDTVKIYVINSTNRLVQVNESFVFEYRDLRSLREIEVIRFKSAKEVEKFFETSFKVLEQGVSIVGQNYRVSRNVISKNVLRVENTKDAYCLLTYDTLSKMQTAFKRSNE